MDQDIVITEDIKEKVEKCIIMTNRVIYRWINTNKVIPSQIYKHDVEAIFFGYVKKSLFNYNGRDYKNFRRLTTIFLTPDNYIWATDVTNDDHYWSSKSKIGLIRDLFNNVKEDIFTWHLREISEEDVQIQQLENLNINFKTIEQITF